MKNTTILGLLSLFCMCLTFQLNAQDLEDCEECSDKEHVECIPFPRLYSEAKSIAGEVKRYKAIPSSLAYTTLVKQHTNLMKKLDAKNETIREAEKDQEDWADDNPGASGNPYDETIKRARAEASTLDKKLIALFNKVEDSHEAYKRLYNARMALKDMFAAVKKKLDYAKGRPKDYIDKSLYEDDDDKVEREKFEDRKDELEGYIAKIKAHIVSEEREHTKQEVAAKKGMDEMAKILQLR